MSNKNYAAVAVLALAGAFASQAHAGDTEFAACKEAVKGAKLTTYANGNASYSNDKLGCTLSLADGKYDVVEGYSKDTSVGSRQYVSAIKAFGTSTGTVDQAATAAATTTPAEKAKDPCDNIVEKNRTASTAIGAVLGGVLGKKLGKGSDVATVGGAVVGGVAGNQIAKCDHK